MTTTYPAWQIEAVPGASELVERIAELEAARLGLLAARNAAQRPWLDASVAEALPGRPNVSRWIPRDDADPDEWAALKRSADASSRSFDDNERAANEARKKLARLVQDAPRAACERAAAEEVLTQGAAARAAYDSLIAAIERADDASQFLGLGSVLTMKLTYPDSWQRSREVVREATHVYPWARDADALLLYAEQQRENRVADAAGVARSVR